MAPANPSTGSDRSGGGKRKADDTPQHRSKIHVARSIPAQPAESALQDGELDLQAFVAAHEFQIRSLEQSMATSKAVSSARAFQQVPRGLRRRTASHNPKRVPRRLRQRAKREMVQDNTPLVEPRRRKPGTTRSRLRVETAKQLGKLAAATKRKKQESEDAREKSGILTPKPEAKIRRNELNPPPLPPAKFRRRQINKTWLPTHVWHAKRARMTQPKNPLWRFAIPLTPSEKIYRPTHRAQGERGAVVWDMSYMSTIGLYGRESGLKRVLQRIGISEEVYWNERGEGWRSGARSWAGILSREANSSRRDMCPAQIVWNAQSSEGGNVDKTKLQRQAFVRVHPSAFLEVFNELLRLTRMENPRVYIEDLRFEIGSIELTGPASTEILLAVLTPYLSAGAAAEKHASLFKSLVGLSNPAALPDRSVLSFSIQDPRLRYPPRKATPPDTEDAQFKLMELLAEWPAQEGIKPAALFDRKARHRATCFPSQQSINRRRGKMAPGEFPKPTIVDPPIPIMLLANRAGSSTQTQGTWTLLLPWKCVLPVWYSIVHCPLTCGGNPRFAGLNESMQVAFERSLPWFPADNITTDAGVNWELNQRAQRHKDWEKRPKSKRTEWGSLPLGAGRKGEVGDGLACDFEVLFGMKRADPAPQEKEQDPDKMDCDVAPASVSKESTQTLLSLNGINKKQLLELTSTSAASSPDPNAVLNVRISAISRGVATSCARIYRLPRAAKAIPSSTNAEVPNTMPPNSEVPHLPHDLRQQWLALTPPNFSMHRRAPREKQEFDLEARKKRLAMELTAPSYPSPPHNQDSIDGHHPLVPDAEDLIGFVTSGSFSLTIGRGASMGAIAVEKVIEDLRSNRDEGHLCIVRNAGENVGWLAKWEAV